MSTDILYRVLNNSQGRYSLWPAFKAIPNGWRETLAAAPKSACLAYVGRNGTNVAARTKPVDFSLMFFGSDEGKGAQNKYQTVIQAARFADTHGFSAIWLPERHFTYMGSLYPNPAVLHAALARETQHIRLRAGSVVLPLHDPIRVAEEWAVVDNLSAGRVEISFAPGWNSEDFVLRPEHYEDRYQVMYEGIRTVERLWSGQSIERTDGQGKRIHVRSYPTPVQPALTKWVTVAGNERSFQQAGRCGAHLLTHLFDQDVSELAEKIKIYRQARAEAGLDPHSGRVAVALHTFLADSMDLVRDKAYPAYGAYLKTNVRLLEKLGQSRGVPIDIAQLSGEQLEQAIQWLFQKFFCARALLGTPESCADLVARLAEAGVHEIACLLDFGLESNIILGGLPLLKRLKDLVASACHPVKTAS